jgi:hypothetical protein
MGQLILSSKESLPRNKKTGVDTAGKMPLPPILTPPEDASANKKRSLSCGAQGSAKEGASRGVAQGTLQSKPTLEKVASTTSTLFRRGELLRHRKSVAEGCDVPEYPPIVVHGRDTNLDKKNHGNKTLLKLILLNLIPYREGHYDVKAVMVRKIVQQIRDWRGRFVKFNKKAKAWEDLSSDDTISLVRGKFDEEALKRRADIDTNVLRFLPNGAERSMDKDKREAYVQLTPQQRTRFRKLCHLSNDDVEDAVTLIEIPPWTHTVDVSPIVAALITIPEFSQNEHKGTKKRRKKSRKKAGHVTHELLDNASGEGRLRTEARSWVDALMLATQDSAEPSMNIDNYTPLQDPISSPCYLWGEGTGLPESDGQQVPVPVSNIDFNRSISGSSLTSQPFFGTTDTA